MQSRVVDGMDMKMNKLNFVIIGTGMISSTHADAINDIEKDFLCISLCWTFKRFFEISQNFFEIIEKQSRTTGKRPRSSDHGRSGIDYLFSFALISRRSSACARTFA